MALTSPPRDGVTGRYFSQLADGRVMCEICPRYCRLKEGQRGLCFVRQARDGVIVSTTWGRSSGFCVDPIEKKPLGHFLPGSAVLSFGTAGCNLACRFCQNWNISTSRKNDTVAEEASPEAIARAAEATGCRSVAFTYNDPVIFLEYAVDVAAACRERGVAAVAVTAGEINPQPAREFFGAMDAANIDLKAFSKDFYRRLCSARLGPVLETLEYVARETDVWLEITTLLIPGENDSDAEISELAQWVVEHLGPSVPVHFSAFQPAFKMKHLPPTPPSTLRRARRRAIEAGLRYVYTGNVSDREGGSTVCHRCGATLIGRDWYRLTLWALDEHGRCRACGEPCAGRFEDSPGRWGGRRLPISPGNY